MPNAQCDFFPNQFAHFCTYTNLRVYKMKTADVKTETLKKEKKGISKKKKKEKDNQ